MKVFTMVSVIVLMVSPPWGQSWRLAALSLLTINLSDQMIMLYFLRTELSMNLLECSIFNRPSAWPTGCWSRNIIGISFPTNQVPGLLVEASWSKAGVVAGGRSEAQLGLSHPGQLIVIVCSSNCASNWYWYIYINPKNPLLSDPSLIIVFPCH